MAFRLAPNNDWYVVPTNDLAAIVIPVLDETAARHEQSNTRDNGDVGPHAELIFQMSRYLGMAEHSVPRRVYCVRDCETFATGLDIADALLLCVGKRLDEVDLPVFPANILTARELVKSRYPRMPRAQREKLAASVFRFGQSYVKESADQKTLDHVREQNAKRKERNARRRLELDEAREEARMRLREWGAEVAA